MQLAHELSWHPPHMVHRLEAWIEGLNSDWNISRQRYFGVPFPVWYGVSDDSSTDYSQIFTPEHLPVDPSYQVPPGFEESQRGKPGGFIADPDVMDTWATSSLTPQIAGGYSVEPELFSKVFPMDLRPQSHEIIRTWLFSTMVRSELSFGQLPWKHIAISGWVLDPDRKKMSKTKGNVITPLPLLESYGPDALRYWSASGRPGVDTAVDENQMKVGRRLAIKLLNASKFVLDRIANSLDSRQLANLETLVTAPMDISMLAYLAECIDAATKSLDGFDYAKALEITEGFFWDFCDDYLELVKIRSYGDGHNEETLSALSALGIALSSILRLFAPFLPFATEEAWSWWHDGSIHMSPWPETSSFSALCKNTDPKLFKTASDLLTMVRRHKSNNKVSMRAEVASIHIFAPQSLIDLLPKVEDDLKAAGNIANILTDVADELSVEVTLKD